MNLDKLFVFLDTRFSDKDNLKKKVKVKEPISKKTFYYAKNATTTYILLSPWHSVPFLFSLIKKKLAKSGFSYVQYDFSPNILTPDVDSTEQYFDKIREEIGNDIKNFTEKYNTEHFVIIGLSLSCVIASMISGLSSKINGLILVVPGNSLAKSLWRGLRTEKIKDVIREEGVSLTELEKDWKKLAPEQYINNFKNKKIKILISKSDNIIPYHLGKKFADEVEKVVSKVIVRENRFLGHYGTVFNFCLISKDIII